MPALYKDGKNYSHNGPKVDVELTKGSPNAAPSGQVYDKIEEIQSQISGDIDRVTQDGVVLTSPYTCTRKRECIRVEVGPGPNDRTGGQIFVNGHLVVKANNFRGSQGSGFSVQTLIYLYEGDVLTLEPIGSGQANAWRVSDD